MTPADILAARGLVDQIYLDDKIKEYIVDVIHATRRPKEYGLEMESLRSRLPWTLSPRVFR